MLLPDDLQTASVADRVFTTLRQHIVEGELAPGSKLNEAELAQRFSVSRSVIRETINRLLNYRIVERRPNAGARVVVLDQAGLLELYTIRESLEGLAARLAAINMTDAAIEDLQALLEEHRAGVDKNNTYYQAAGDYDLHYRIALGSGNRQLMHLLMDDLYYLIRMYRIQCGVARQRLDLALDEHEQIVKAIARRDAELAELLMRRHIESLRQALASQVAGGVQA